MNQYSIKNVSLSDVAEIRKLLVYVWGITFDPLLSSHTINQVTSICFDEALLADQIKDPSNTFLMAVDEGGKILGMANARQDENQTIILNRLYVHPSFHGNGIGTILLDSMIRCFQNAGNILLEVVNNNDDSIRFYLNYGFQITGTNENIIGDIILSVNVMEKKIMSIQGNER